MKNLKGALLLAAGLFTGATFATFAVVPRALDYYGVRPTSEVAHPGEAFANTPTPALTRGPDGSSLADVVERVMPSVVNISATRVVASSQMGGGSGPFGQDPMFRDFFGGQGGPQQERDFKQNSLGSGVIISEDGLILTNNHVVEHASDLRVTLSDGRELTASIAGTDPKSDLAVLKLQGKPQKLQALPFGKSAKLRLGEVVLAVGNPFGVGQAVTMGIVSAKGRSHLNLAAYEDFIQTDAAINPGNSGGALINTSGELIGINTAILSRTGGYQGIGFAIPSDMAQPIMSSLIRDGAVKRGWLGVGIQDVDSNLAEAMKLSDATGVLIRQVDKSGPAARAGLRRGDVVKKIDGTEVKEGGALRNQIAAAGPNATVALEVVRNGVPQTFKVKLGSDAESEKQAKGADAPVAATGKLLGGVSVSDLTPQARQRFQVDDAIESGVVVVGVAENSPAGEAGLNAGDVIVEVNQKPVRSAKEFASQSASASGKVLLLVNRGGTTVFLALRK